MVISFGFAILGFNSFTVPRHFIESSSIKLPSISRILEDLEQESQRRTREVEALEQQLSKAAADTWRDLPSWKWTKWPDIDFASSNVAGKRMLVRKLLR